MAYIECWQEELLLRDPESLQTLVQDTLEPLHSDRLLCKPRFPLLLQVLAALLVNCLLENPSQARKPILGHPLFRHPKAAPRLLSDLLSPARLLRTRLQKLPVALCFPLKALQRARQPTAYQMDPVLSSILALAMSLVRVRVLPQQLVAPKKALPLEG